MYFFNESTRKAAEKFRTALYVSAADSDLTQTQIAVKAGIEQSCFSQYLAPNSDKNFPAFLVPLLPAKIAIDLVNFLADAIGHILITKADHMKLSGNTDDELIDLVRLEGEFIQLRNKDVHAARKKIAELRDVLERMDAEEKLLEKK